MNSVVEKKNEIEEKSPQNTEILFENNYEVASPVSLSSSIGPTRCSDE